MDEEFTLALVDSPHQSQGEVGEILLLGATMESGVQNSSQHEWCETILAAARSEMQRFEHGRGLTYWLICLMHPSNVCKNMMALLLKYKMNKKL